MTNAAQVRALTPVEAANQIPVHVRGVLLWNNRGGDFTIQDDTAGVYVHGANHLGSNFGRGDLIEVEGNSDPGKFAPFIDARMARKIGAGRLPEPHPANQDDLLSGRMDAQWIEVSGVVRRVEPVWQALNLEVDLENGAGRMLVNAAGGGRAVAVDSTVRLRGVCFYQFNKMRQALRPFLAIPSGEPIVVTEPAQTNLAALPVRSVESLTQFSPAQSYVHRVRVRGVVIHSQPGEGFWIRDESHGLRVICKIQEPLAIGTEVDVFGFLKRGDYGPVMEDAVFQRTGKTLPALPVHLANAGEALDHDSDLVECEAVIQEQWLALDGCRLKLSDGSTEFPAVLRVTKEMPLPQHWSPGARVRVAGICAVSSLATSLNPGTLEPQHFQILLRSPGDVTILRAPPWWNAEHVAWVAGGAAITLLLVVALVVWISRQRLRAEALERTKSEAEFAAVMNERNRMARELHDTLAQGLGAISLRLELAKRQLPAESSARDTLEEAGTQTRASLAEVRGAIWNMRSQSLETGDLASAINSVLHSMADRDQVKSELRVIGEPRRFAPVVENNLLRIAQEAIANAAKYAWAKQIEVTLKFDRQQFELCVSDDGQGFDPSNPPASAGGFGLIGMRERAAELHGHFTVTSAPGKGCIVKLVLPFSNS